MNQFGPIVIIILILISTFFSGGDFTIQSFLQRLLYSLPAILIGFSFHEFAHAFVAERLGDPTPRQEGRITLDIRKHMEPIGMLLVILFGFGWAKPVGIDTRNLKNPKIGMALIGVAGPVMNILIALITVIIMLKVPMNSQIAPFFLYMFYINVGLAVFNLIPVPPLDGSRVIGAFLSNSMYYKFVEFEYKYANIAFIVLFLLIYLDPGVFDFIFSRATRGVEFLGTLIANILPF